MLLLNAKYQATLAQKLSRFSVWADARSIPTNGDRGLAEDNSH